MCTCTQVVRILLIYHPSRKNVSYREGLPHQLCLHLSQDLSKLLLKATELLLLGADLWGREDCATGTVSDGALTCFSGGEQLCCCTPPGSSVPSHSHQWDLGQALKNSLLPVFTRTIQVQPRFGERPYGD